MTKARLQYEPGGTGLAVSLNLHERNMNMFRIVYQAGSVRPLKSIISDLILLYANPRFAA